MKSPVKIWREKEERCKYLDRVGRVVSFTKIYEPPNGLKGRCTVVMVKVNKEKVVGQLVDCKNDSLEIGDKVVGVIRRLGESLDQEVIEYGVKWKRL